MGQRARQGSDEQHFYCNRRGGWYRLRDFHCGKDKQPNKIPVEQLDVAAALFGRAPVPPYYVDKKGYSMVMHAKTANTNDERVVSVRSIYHIDYTGSSCAWNGCMV